MGKTTLYTALKLIFPPVCLHCKESHGKLKVPLCNMCISHLEVRPVSGDIIVTFEGIGPAKSLISSLKNGSASHLSPLLAAYMAVQYSQSTLPLPDVITAVPSSRWRKWQMGQESATILAKDFAKLLERPFLPLLKRKRQLLRQEFLTREERAFLPPEEFQWLEKFQLKNQRLDSAKATELKDYKEKLRGKTILLIDDTITTGATLACCAERLWEASPTKIFKMACVDRGYLQG